MNPQIVVVDPYDKGSSLLMPFVTQRMLQFARDYAGEMDPEQFVSTLLARLYARDPLVRVIAFVGDGMKVVGHAVATIETDGAKRVTEDGRLTLNCWVFVSQLRADDNLGTALDDAVEMAREWGRQSGATRVLQVTGRNERGYERRLGFRTIRRVMELPIDEKVPERVTVT